MHHIFVKKNQIIDNSIIINNIEDIENFNHLKSSLRVNINENILVSVIDELINYNSIVKNISDREIILEIIEIAGNNELGYKINLYQGLVKLDKFEYIIEKAVELGVFTITPVEMKNSIVKLKNDKIEKKIERYNKISKSASEQSKRSIIPIVNNPISFRELIDLIKDNDNNLLFYENEIDFDKTKSVISSIKDKNKKIINIIIGPEGGFSKAEIDMALDFNINILTLGKRTLRTETASIVALSFLLYNLE